MAEKVIISGAGLCGTLLGIRLAKAGFQVELFEKRPDLREKDQDAGKSINLALSNRGLKALASAGIEKEALAMSIPMQGRCIHDLSGNTRISRYSGREQDQINSISRPGLNALLLEKAETLPNLSLHFDHKVFDVDHRRKEVLVENKRKQSRESHNFDYLFGTDGAGSVVRKSIFNHSATHLFNFSQDFLKHGYKELTIPPGKNGTWRIEKNVLHIWPRGSYMLIALPNLDGSFTVTLFLPFKGENSFEVLDNSSKALHEFFQTQFPDAIEHMPDLAGDYHNNPTGILGTIKCHPWYNADCVMLMGDAAHAVVPFYGQGMNCSFEDVLLFEQTLLDQEGKMKATMAAYDKFRHIDSSAIADLAIDNFFEMRDHVANPLFMRKRKLELQLEKTYPDYYSKYSLVTFREDLPYSIAMEQGRKQDKFLLKLCEKTDPEINLELAKVYEKLKKAGFLGK